MKLLFASSVLAVNVLFATGSTVDRDPPKTVDYVDIPRYLGKWNELARMPNSFQDNTREDFGVCYNTVAEYTKKSEDKITVKNTCQRYNKEGQKEEEIATARGSIVDGSGNAKLKVNFTGILILDWLGIGDGDYWILGLGPINSDGLYSWAFVGAPKRNFGWILSRTKQLPTSEQEKIQKIIVEKGYSPTSFQAFIR